MKKLPPISDELSELLSLLSSRKIEFIVAGAHAMAAYARPRYTEDLDLFVSRDRENIERLAAALEEFGTPMDPGGVDGMIEKSRAMVRLGSPPSQLDILNFLTGLTFDEAAKNAVPVMLAGLPVKVLALEDLKKTKHAAGRPKDLEDLRRLNDGD